MSQSVRIGLVKLSLVAGYCALKQRCRGTAVRPLSTESVAGCRGRVRSLHTPMQLWAYRIILVRWAKVTTFTLSEWVVAAEPACRDRVVWAAPTRLGAGHSHVDRRTPIAVPDLA